MKKLSKYFFYYLVLFVPIYFMIGNKLLTKENAVLVWAILFVVALGAWWWITRLFKHTENRWVRYGSVLLGSLLYIGSFILLDLYVFHIVIPFTGYKPFVLGFRMFMGILTAIIFFESMEWARAREQAQIDNLRLQAENIDANFQLLKQKINPDFLFHCLTTVQTMIQSNNPKTEDFILKLADVYRQTLKNQKNTITLKEELNLLKTYLFLMQSGRETAILFEINVSDASMNYELPTFTLQTLADDCIKKNEFSNDSPLHIRIYQKDDESVTIAHSFQPKTDYIAFNTATLEMQYELEGIENGVFVEKEKSIYSITLKLF